MRQPTLAASVALVLASTATQAALQDEHNGQLYDNVTGLVWLQDANLAATDNFGVSAIPGDGRMEWSTAQAWVAAMNVANYHGHNDWRLPTVSPVNGASFNFGDSYGGTSDQGYNIGAPGTAHAGSNASELAYMYYQNLGLKAYYSPAGVEQADYGVFRNGTVGGQADVGLVRNLQSYAYWSGTASSPDPTYGAWFFYTTNGYQDNYYHHSGLAAWAVRPGDAADVAAVVPEPETYALLLAGLGLLGVVARRRRNPANQSAGTVRSAAQARR